MAEEQRISVLDHRETWIWEIEADKIYSRQSTNLAILKDLARKQVFDNSRLLFLELRISNANVQHGSSSDPTFQRPFSTD
jgi:hypothetical protein